LASTYEENIALPCVVVALAGMREAACCMFVIAAPRQWRVTYVRLLK
jgi:hypothetical protein